MTVQSGLFIKPLFLCGSVLNKKSRTSGIFCETQRLTARRLALLGSLSLGGLLGFGALGFFGHGIFWI